MALESATYLDDLVDTNPEGDDQRSTADDHIRLLKTVLQNTFPNITGVVSATQAETNLLHGATVTTDQINYLGDVSASLQSQINAKLGVSATAADSVLFNGSSAGYYLALGNATGTISNSNHGARAGGNLHSIVTSATAGFMSAAHKTKLDGIESGATGDQTGSEILNLLLDVDGADSGLDAQYLAGQNGAYYRALGNATGSINDSQHGNRGGGSLHNVATTGANGFMSAADKTILNTLAQSTTTVSLGGDFDGLAQIRLVRVGNMVVVTAEDSTLNHTLMANPESDAGVIPSTYRPEIIVYNVFNETGFGTERVYILTDGTIGVFHRDWTGSNNNRSFTTGLSVAYYVP